MIALMCNNQLALLFAFALLLPGCGQKSDASPSKSSSHTGSAKYFKPHFQNESEFITEAIATDLAEMVFYAKNKNLPDAANFLVEATEGPDSRYDKINFEVHIALLPKRDPMNVTVRVNAPIWAPELYDDLSSRLVQEVGWDKKSPANEQDDFSVLTALTDGTAVSIEEVNQAVSTSLQENFTSPSLHEKAAVVLGAFMLRDSSGQFFDIRSPLCRMTAHLSMARQLRGNKGFGVNGRLAEVMLYTLMNHQKGALAKLSQLDNSNKYLAIWSRVLKARNTYDYRLFSAAKDLGLLEKTAWLRASAASADLSIAWDQIKPKELAQAADYCRIANAVPSSVQIGQQLLKSSIGLELQETREIYQKALGRELKQQDLENALNEMPERCFTVNGKDAPKVRVIGWGMWANFLQRHLCHAIHENFFFMKFSWGVPHEAYDFGMKSNEMFGGLYLYPFVRLFTTADKIVYRKAVDAGYAITVATPHLTPIQCFNSLCGPDPSGEKYCPNPNPHGNEWLVYNPPPFTAYDPEPRMYYATLMGRSNALAIVENLHAIAPCDPRISECLMEKKYPHAENLEHLSEVYAPVLEYSVSEMVKVAESMGDNAEGYEKLMTNAAAASPRLYFKLAQFFVQRKDENKGASYYEKACELEPDRVMVSNYAQWLVDYYLTNGEVAKAKTLADECGEVYSCAGLITKAKFLEKTGKYDDALKWFKKAEQRYGSSSELAAFSRRYQSKTGEARFDPELEDRARWIFHGDVEHVTLSSFDRPPSDGVDVREENDATRLVGLRQGNIIVAIDGVRVHKMEQYSFIRDCNLAAPLKLIVWQGDHYREIEANPPNRVFGAKFGSYPAVK